MSKVQLSGDISGSGVITLAAPNTNSTVTLTLPTASGTINTSGSVNEVPAGTVSAPSIYPTGDTNTGIFFPAADTIAFTEGGVEAMRIDSSGNVGIGTSAPGNILHVVAASQSDNNGFIRAENTATTPNSATNASFVAKNYFGTSQFMQWENNGVRIGSRTTANGGSGNVIFVTGSDSEAMRIDSSGNLLVGTTTALSAQLSVENPISQESIAIRNSSSTAGRRRRITVDNNNTFYILDETTTGVYLGQGSTSWTGISDERHKDVIEPIENAASKVSSLRAVIGKYKTDEDGVRRSFLIAQDVQAVFPEAVDTTDPDKLGLRYTELIPLLTAAIQEQQALIQDLTARLEALENK
jgi:hypothetical protein